MQTKFVNSVKSLGGITESGLDVYFAPARFISSVMVLKYLYNFSEVTKQDDFKLSCEKRPILNDL